MVLYSAVESEVTTNVEPIFIDPIKVLTTANDRNNDCHVFSNVKERLTSRKGTVSSSSAIEGIASPAD